MLLYRKTVQVKNYCIDTLSQMVKFENIKNIYTCTSSSSDHLGSSPSSTSDGGYMLASTNPKKRAGRRKFKETRHSVYRGIRRRNGDKWVCELRNKKSRLWLGTYPNEEMAARAHDVAALALRGKSACLNFADSVCRLPVPVSTSDDDIRKAAVEAAEAFRPQEGGDVEIKEWKRDCSDAESSLSLSSSSKIDVRVKECAEELSNEESGFYMDEEAMLFMPQLLVDLANGLLLPPPTLFDEDSTNLSFDDGADIALWNY